MDNVSEDTQGRSSLSKVEVEALFQAGKRERENLDSDFCKRVCLRDLVMLELLFYHGIEVSELLRLEVSDYNRKSGVLVLRGKNGKWQQESSAGKMVQIFSKTVKEHMAYGAVA